MITKIYKKQQTDTVIIGQKAGIIQSIERRNKGGKMVGKKNRSQTVHAPGRKMAVKISCGILQK